MDNSNPQNPSAGGDGQNQDQNQEKIEDIKKDYKIETMSDNITEESAEKAEPETVSNIKPPADIPTPPKKEIDVPETPKEPESEVKNTETEKTEKKPIFSNLNNGPSEMASQQEVANENVVSEEKNITGSEQSNFRRFLPFIIGFAGILIIGLIAISVIYIFSGNEDVPVQDNTPVITEDVEDTEIIVEQPLFPIDQTLIVNIDDTITRIDFLSQLNDIIKQSSDLSVSGEVIRLYLTSDNKKITLDELMLLLNITDIDVNSYFNTDNYILFYHDSLDGMRFGLVAEVFNEAAVKDYIKEIEDIIISLNNQIFSEYTSDILDKSSSEGFNDSIYQEVDVRFINFDNPDLSIDYAFKNNNFVIAGSMETMHEIIDRINLMENAQ